MTGKTISINFGKEVPDVTVLMSVYNGERWLEEVIRSILGQTFANFEFVIVNDGSTDSSLKIIKRFAGQDSRIHIIDKPNSGLADSLNQGINIARGKWIARIDADDLCEPERLFMQYAFAQKDPSLVLIGTGLRVIDQYGKLIKKYYYPKSHKALLSRLTSAQAFFAHSSAFYKAEVVKAIGGYRKRIKRSQDLDLWLRLSEVGCLACIDKPLVSIRQHDDQVTHEDGGKRQILDACIALISYWSRCQEFDDPVSLVYSDANFMYFQEWVFKRLSQEKIFENYASAKQLRKQILCKSYSLPALLKALPILLGKIRIVLQYLYQKVLGESFTKRLSLEWELMHRKY